MESISAAATFCCQAGHGSGCAGGMSCLRLLHPPISALKHRNIPICIRAQVVSVIAGLHQSSFRCISLFSQVTGCLPFLDVMLSARHTFCALALVFIATGAPGKHKKRWTCEPESSPQEPRSIATLMHASVLIYSSSRRGILSRSRVLRFSCPNAAEPPT